MLTTLQSITIVAGGTIQKNKWLYFLYSYVKYYKVITVREYTSTTMVSRIPIVVAGILNYYYEVHCNPEVVELK